MGHMDCVFLFSLRSFCCARLPHHPFLLPSLPSPCAVCFLYPPFCQGFALESLVVDCHLQIPSQRFSTMSLESILCTSGAKIHLMMVFVEIANDNIRQQ